MKPENLQVLKQSYDDLLKIINNLYDAGENALAVGDDSDASLLFSQGDTLFIASENLNAVISEQEEL